MIKFIHIADLHANKERKSICLKALSELKDLIIKESLNGISPTLLFAGDFGMLQLLIQIRQDLLIISKL